MKALICGSLAFDVIMVFEDRFKNHILPDKVHMLSVSFVVPKLRREFGGCAGNIAYNLGMLGGTGNILATVGEDFGPYFEWMTRHNISRDYVHIVPETYTAQCYITTDLDDNQINAFHPGAMDQSWLLDIPTGAGFTLGLISPDNPEGIKKHASQFAEAGIPFIFDPGQAITRFKGEELLTLIEQATYLAVNDYECQLVQHYTGLSTEQLTERLDALIVTRGSEGSYIVSGNEQITIPAAEPQQVVDPTGCGDAYRAGLLYGLMQGFDWETTGRIASLAGTYKVEVAGTQNHSYDSAEFRARFKDSFGYSFE